ncbi:hypothetical protein [Thiomicrospira cyclica]|uniref:Uncharacterized protein n=1 Tax=Thiomicrospira cyclica (strain DSM 14477 / JCM 11371 / ALM1) TaxID=717773 RepID=F6DBI1_THICA|nr:hypothetical protein [Thiomicrospira cyclica]AEG32383.1 hypothetical protein Thicy_1626 [Thiomicrospira cyclica ALM1]
MKQPIHNPLIHLALSEAKLAELFRLGVLCAADVDCLDVTSRDQVQRLCLQTCAQQLCAVCPSRSTCSKGQSSSSKHVVHWPNLPTIKSLIN